MSARTSAVGSPRTEAAAVTGVINEAEHNRHIGTTSNTVKPRLPVFATRASSFGGHDQSQSVLLGELGHEIGDHGAGLIAHNRHAAKLAHERTHWATEQFVLTEPRELDAAHFGQRQHHWEIPVGRVRRSDDHTALWNLIA